MKVLSTVGALTACASCATAFVTPSVSHRVLSTPKTLVRMSEEVPAEPEAAASVEEPVPAPAPGPLMSESIPFLKKPKNLDGMVGDIGFDPFGLAEIFPVKFMRESELKHGRVAMLAVVGWLVSEVVHLPGPAYSSENPVDAMAAVGPGPMLQIFFFIGFLEWTFHNVSLLCLYSHFSCFSLFLFLTKSSHTNFKAFVPRKALLHAFLREVTPLANTTVTTKAVSVIGMESRRRGLQTIYLSCTCIYSVHVAQAILF